MNVYKAGIILNSEIIDNAKQVLYDNLKLLEKDFIFTKIEEWGEKELAYPVRDYKEEYYIAITFACNYAEIVDNMNSVLNCLQNSDYIIKYIITEIDVNRTRESLPSIVLSDYFKMEEKKEVMEKFICSECKKEIEKENYYKYVWAKIDNENRNRLVLVAENVCNECLNNILKEKNIHETEVFYYDIEELIEINYNDVKYYYYDYNDAQDDYFYKCEHCGEWINESCDDYIHIDGTYFCSEDCADAEGYRQCDECYEWVCEDNICTDWEQERRICNNCIENSYYYCADCGYVVHESDAICINGEWYCPSCAENVEECETERQEYVCDYHHYGSNYWQPRFYKNTSSDNLFGIELEVESTQPFVTCNEIVKKVCEIDTDEVFVFEHDGSLTNGFEIISNPCSLNYWYSKEENLKKIFEVLNNMGCKSHDVSTCGLHIHFSRDYVDTATISRILYLFEKFKNYLIMFSRRKIDNLNRWASFMNVDVKDLSLDYVKSNHDNCNRYRAVNLTNNETIEIRIFKGTLKFESFMSCIELVNNIVEMAKNMNDNEIINVESFYNVVEYQKTKYLKQYCLDRRIVENVSNIESEG